MAKEVVWATKGGFRITSACSVVLSIYYDEDTSLLLILFATSSTKNWAVMNHTQIETALIKFLAGWGPSLVPSLLVLYFHANPMYSLSSFLLTLPPLYSTA